MTAKRRRQLIRFHNYLHSHYSVMWALGVLGLMAMYVIGRK